MNVEVDYPTGRKRTIVEAEYIFTLSSRKRKYLNIRNLIAAAPPEAQVISQESLIDPNLTSYGVTWEKAFVQTPIGRPILRK